MGLGGTAKKVQQMVDIAETLHARVMDIKDRVEGTQVTVDETAARVEAIETELAEQRKLLDALAEAQGLDIDVDAAVGDSDSDGSEDNA